MFQKDWLVDLKQRHFVQDSFFKFPDKHSSVFSSNCDKIFIFSSSLGSLINKDNALMASFFRVYKELN
jgi:hypothetical protein